MQTLSELVRQIESFRGDYTTLQTLLAEARKQLEQLQAELTLWQESSTEWEARSLEAEETSRKLTASLDALSEKLSRSEVVLEAERAEGTRQRLTREGEIRTLRTLVLILAGVAIAAGGTAAVALSR